MTPFLAEGTRKLFTPLDFAGLVDIGWNLQSSGMLSFSASAYSVRENAGTAAITITRSEATRFAVVRFATSDGTATAGNDYQPITLFLTFGPGETRKTINIPILDDHAAEPNETVILYLNQGVGVAAGPVIQSVLTIVDDDRVKNGMSDFDADGKTDVSIFRPSQARWLSNESGGGTLNTVLGETGLVDIPAPGDYDGDGKTDLIVYRPSQDLWIGRLSGGGILNTHFGIPGLVDIPAPGDYDGDGKTDLAVYRPSQNRWIAQLSGGGTMNLLFGVANLVDIPAPGDYDGDGKTDLAVYRPSQNRWIAQLSGGGTMNILFGVPTSSISRAGNYDGDGKTDLAVYRPSQSRWIGQLSGGGTMNRLYGTPNLFDVPTQASFGSLMTLGVLTPAAAASSLSAPERLGLPHRRGLPLGRELRRRRGPLAGGRDDVAIGDGCCVGRTPPDLRDCEGESFGVRCHTHVRLPETSGDPRLHGFR